GMVLYHCLTGAPPFIRNTVIEILNAHKFEEPTPLEQLLPNCPRDVIQIFKKSTAKRLEDRYLTIDAMLESIKDIQRAKERKREIAEKKQLSQEVVAALMSAKVKQSPASSRTFSRNLGPILAILGLLTALMFVLYPKESALKPSKTSEVAETREIDFTWVHGKKSRLAGKLVRISESANGKVVLTINMGFLETTVVDERDILFEPTVWESIQQTHPLSCKVDTYVVFQGKAVVDPDKIPYLEGQKDSPITIPNLKRFHLQYNKTSLIAEEFPETLNDEYVQVKGMILNLQEYENELIFCLADLNNSKISVSITQKNLKDIEKRNYSPRVGDEVYAIGHLSIQDKEDKNGQKIFTYKIYVEDNKGEFFTMEPTRK
ncbi:MAG: hypothetical protein AABZ60_14790, partial [Planctomycetota bacterium]